MAKLQNLNGKAPRWTRSEKLTARRLYLLNRWTPAEIAEKFGRTPQACSNLIWREGWAEIRDRADEKARAEAEAKAVDVARGFQESVAMRAEELTERSFDVAEAAADEGNAKDLAFASSAVKNFAAVTRQALGLDAKAASVSVTLNTVFARPAAAPMKTVAPEPITEGENDLDFA